MSKPAHRTCIRWQVADGYRMTLKVTSSRIGPWEIRGCKNGFVSVRARQDPGPKTFSH
jgi:hypothetical protein